MDMKNMFLNNNLDESIYMAIKRTHGERPGAESIFIVKIHLWT